MSEFQQLGLGPRLGARLAAMGLTDPTPVQRAAIPEILSGHDLLALAQTGTGKTLAFSLPVMRKIDAQSKPAKGAVRVVVLSPTRELAQQTFTTLRELAEDSPLSVVLAAGGIPVERQAARLEHGTDFLVATPGRLIDLLEREAVSLDRLRHLVLDEVDRMLDLGFVGVLTRISRYLPEKRQTLMFSATMPQGIEEIAEDWLVNPKRLDLTPPSRVADGIAEQVEFVAQGAKARALEAQLKTHPGEAALVFARTRERAEKTAELLAHWGMKAGALHGDRKQGQRDRVLEGFRGGEIEVLVATDVAARGLDLPLVRHVYNYDLPVVPETYVHRIGRTARAGRTGRALAFVAPAEMMDLRAIEALTGRRLERVAGDPWPEEMALEARRKAGLPIRSAEGEEDPEGQGGGGHQGRGKPGGAKPGSRPQQRSGPKTGPKSGTKSSGKSSGARPPRRP